MWPATPCPAPGSQGKQTPNQSSRWNSQQLKGKCLMPPGVLPLFPLLGELWPGRGSKGFLMCSEVSSPGRSPQEAFIGSFIHPQIFLEHSFQVPFSAKRVLNRLTDPLACAAQPRGPVSGELGESPTREAQKTSLGDEERNLPLTGATSPAQGAVSELGHPRTANPTSQLTLLLSAAHTRRL